MCGIAGIVSKQDVQSSFPLLQKAIGTLTHRGPEQEAFWQSSNGTAVLGHSRLCIIDIGVTGAQPMHYAGRYTIIYNGEIYNYIELRQELKQKGHSFQSQSDTEVVLAAYAEWGYDCVKHFDGAFAFAVWDESEQTLFAARDRFGEKPFFFFHNDEQFIFASELKALWEMNVEKEINQSLLYNFLTIGYTSNPADNTETFYNNIYKLPAAHYLVYQPQKNELQLQPYWQAYIDVNENITEAEAVETFNQLFADSIRKRLRSDVAIGTSLSGGLDSSSIVAFCQEEKASQYTHKCFTASFTGFEKDETKYASLVAERFKLNHFTTTIHTDEVPELMDKVALQQDEPFSSASVLAQYKVFALAKENGVTVLLDGQGADEILGGYHKYYKWYWQELYRSRKLSSSGEWQKAKALGVQEPFTLKNKVAALLPDFAGSLLQSRKNKQAFQHPDLERDFAFRNKRSLYYSLPTYPTLNGALHYNTFVDGLEELLRLADRNSMAHSVEVRLPFLQHQLVEFLFTLPPHLKIQEGWTKWLLRKAVDHKLPSEIVWRKDKTGYEPPQKTWMENKDVQERIVHAKQVLVQNGVLDKNVMVKAVVPKGAHDANSFDWRFWSASFMF